jgi:hypothetical protein
MNSGALSDDGAMANSATSPAQCISENSQENDRCNDTLEGEEVLDLGVRNAQEWKLKEEVQHKATHSCRCNALTLGYVIWNIGEAWPDGCEQNRHALTASCGLDAELS